MIWFFKLTKTVSRVSNRAIFTSIITIVFISSFYMHIVEPEKFKNAFDGLWFTMTTLTTVGYGDYFPVTVAGRLWTIFLFCAGVGTFTLAISRLFEYLANIKRKMEEGKMDFKGKGQIIVIGWSGKSRVTIKNILKKEPDTHVVLIDEKLVSSPFMDKSNFHFIKGVASRTKVLEKANIKEAKKILVFAEEKLKLDSPYDADAKTAFIATSIERMAKDIDTTVEIILEENKENFAHIDSGLKFQLSDEAFANLMYAND